MEASPGNILRKMRKLRRLTQKRLAEKMDVSRLTVNELELDKRAFTENLALRLTTVFRRTPVTFWLDMERARRLARARAKIRNHKKRKR